MSAGDRYPPSIELATLWERESARGKRYMSGYLGKARLTLLPGEPTGDGTPTWRLLIAQAPPRGAAKSGEVILPRRAAKAAEALYSPRGRPAGVSPIRPDSVAPLDDTVGDLWPGDER